MTMKEQPLTALPERTVRLSVGNWIALVGLALATVSGVLAPSYAMYIAVEKRVSTLEEDTRDHAKRITIREANAFTAQDANKLNATVTRLATEAIAIQRSVERLYTKIDQLERE